MYTIYHNPRCSKSRAGLSYLKEKGFEFEIIDYLKNPLTKNELKDVLMKMNKQLFSLVMFETIKHVTRDKI